MVAAGVFVVVAAVACAAALLAIMLVTHVRMSGPEAIERDGLARGARAPAWSLADDAGTVRRSPPSKPLQLIVFADHSLKSFPSVAEGLAELRGESARLETILMPRRRSELAAPLLAPLGLGWIPVVAGSPALYADYNVRVGPFAIFVDDAGQVRASSLVNHAWQLAKLLQLASIPLEPKAVV